MTKVHRLGPVLKRAMTALMRAISLPCLHRLHLSTRRERLFLLSKFFYNFRELDYFLSLLSFRRQFIFLAKEGFSRSTQLREPIIDHLFVTVNISDPNLLILIDTLLRDSLVEVLLLGAQVAQVDVDLGQSSGLLVHFLVGGFTLAEDAEGAIVPIARQRIVVGLSATITIDRGVVHIFSRRTVINLV